MLRKYQVLIPDWLEEYIKYLADSYDLSFSEIIRAEVCYAILCHVSKFFPDYKSGINPDEILGLLIPRKGEELEREELHRIMSKIYFETRKAIEHRLSMEAPPKKK
jgi:hypothetical protein